MSEFRRDPFLGRWTIVAEGRSARPNEYARTAAGGDSASQCPFCEGHEDRTPSEVAAVRLGSSVPDGPGWAVRAIPNRFPTVTRDPSGARVSSSPPFEREPAVGVHEVIVEAPRHGPDLPYLDDAHHRTLFRFFRDRVRAASRAPGMGAVLLFENRGPESGGTLPHPHAQLVATQRLSPRMVEERRAFESGDGASCRLEAIVAAEIRDGSRIVTRENGFTVFAPFASEFPYEVWIVPDRHAPTFAEATDAETDGLASVLPRLLRALDAARSRPSYNWFVHGDAAPAGETRFHWHLEVAPRLVRPDGYELGSGVAVNPVPPESAAAELRARVGADARGAGQQP